MSFGARIFFVLFGGTFLAVGIAVGVFGARAAAAEADRAAQLRPLNAVAIERSAPGSEVLVEALLSARNPVRFRQYVAYSREEYRGSDDDGDPIWREDERVTPRLLLEADGLIQLANEDYFIVSPHERWQEEGALRYSSFNGGTKRYEGLLADAVVTAIGVVQAGQEGNELNAEFVFGGTRSEYIESKRNEAGFLPIFGLIFGGVGFVLLLVGVFLRR